MQGVHPLHPSPDSAGCLYGVHTGPGTPHHLLERNKSGVAESLVGDPQQCTCRTTTFNGHIVVRQPCSLTRQTVQHRCQGVSWVATERGYSPATCFAGSVAASGRPCAEPFLLRQTTQTVHQACCQRYEQLALLSASQQCR